MAYDGGMPMTLGLQNLRGQTDEAFPNRDRTSDGGEGNEEHKRRTSGHNRDDTPGSKPAWNGDSDKLPEWRAWDCDADLRAPGITTQEFVDHIINLPNVENVIRYVISDGWIYHSRVNFQRQKYTGDNQHTKHVHFEGQWSDESDKNTSFDFRLGDLFMLSDADKKWLSGEIDKAATKAAQRVWATKWDIGKAAGTAPHVADAGSIVAHIPGEHTRIEQAITVAERPADA
jgi:hypothetical protein